MMNSSSHSRNKLQYSSESWHDSQSFPGVRFAINKISLGARLALTEQLGALLRQHEFLRAGDSLENTEASLADLLVRRLYLEWGLLQIDGLLIDGSPATVELVIESGPEGLSNEIVAAIRANLELSEEERKNS